MDTTIPTTSSDQHRAEMGTALDAGIAILEDIVIALNSDEGQSQDLHTRLQQMSIANASAQEAITHLLETNESLLPAIPERMDRLFYHYHLAELIFGVNDAAQRQHRIEVTTAMIDRHQESEIAIKAGKEILQIPDAFFPIKEHIG